MMKIKRREIKLCECGCGQVVKNRFVSGHNSCMRIGEKHHFYGKHFSRDIVEKRNKSISDAYKEPEHKKNKIEGTKKSWENDFQRKEEMSKRMSGENNPAKRPEVREFLSKKMKERIITDETKNKISKIVEELWKNQEYIDKHCGENHPQWIGGLSEYPKEFNNKLKEMIRQRDNYQCQLCFKFQDKLDTRLDVHHIDYDKKNCNEDNLISLCKRCHRRTNNKKDRNKWTNLLSFQ